MSRQAPPPQYKDFSKPANDLLGKVFPKSGKPSSWGVEFDFKPAKYFKVNAKVLSNGTGEISDSLVFEDLGFTFASKFNTEKPTFEASLLVDDKIPADGVSAKIHFDASNQSQTAGFSFKVQQEYLDLGARVYIPVNKALLDFVDEAALKEQNTKFEGDFVATHPDYKIFAGAVAKLEFPSGADMKKNELGVSVGWKDASFTSDVSYTQGIDAKSGEDTKVAACKVVAKPGETVYVAELQYDLVDQETGVTLGLSYPLRDGATVKSKVSSKKEIGLAYSRNLSPGTKFDFGVLSNVAGDKIESTFAFNLKFTQ